MIDIVEFLVFSIVMLLFMAYPAMKINEFLVRKYSLSKNAENILLIVLIIGLSLFIGAFLKWL